MDPITAAILLMAASTGLGQRAKNQERKRLNDYMGAEQGRQEEYGRQARENINTQLDKVSMPTQEARTPGIVAAYENMVQPSLGASPAFTGEYQNSQSGAPREVRSELARKIHDAVAAGRDQAKASAALNAEKVLSMDRGIALTQGAGELNRIRAFSQGSSAILPYEQNYAHESVAGTRTASDVAGMLGNAFMLYGLTSGAPAAVDPKYALPTVSSTGLRVPTRPSVGARVPTRPELSLRMPGGY